MAGVVQTSSGYFLKGLFALGLSAFLCMSARTYNSEYFHTRARLGPKTLYYYDNLITNAWGQNPFSNELSLQFAQVQQTKNNWEGSRQTLLKSAAGVNHWQGWELQGLAWEKLAFTDAGTLEDADKAVVLYDRILSVYPSYEKGIERRAVLGLKLGDWESVTTLATRLITLDANNRNALYLRARVAEGIGDTALARDIYGQLSASGAPISGSLFSSEEIIKRLSNLREEQLR